ncbi:hypothetical protein U1Q18_021062 [Sarracenia purpurea var. burkii]
MLGSRETSPPAAAMKAEVSSSFMASFWKSESKNEYKNKRRFSDEQIRTLELMFETESRPELQMKQRLANEIGLQPRQVAIWFQNKRARSKSKLIEQQYIILKNSYDTLASKFNSLKKENQQLRLHLRRLRNLVEKPQESTNHEVVEPGKRIDKENDNADTNSEAEVKRNLSLASDDHEIGVPFYDDSSENVEYFGGAANILDMGELGPNSSFPSSGNWCTFETNFELSCVLNHPSSSQWWDP